jgi:hypothetical protein
VRDAMNKDKRLDGLEYSSREARPFAARSRQRHPSEATIMTKRRRTIIVLVLIELLLAGGWFWLHTMALSSPRASADSTRVIGQVFGAAMGIVLALAPFLYMFARRNDLKGKG